MEKYIADKKVFTTQVLEGQKTPGGSEMIQVNYEDGTKEVMPMRRYEIIVTDKISDASEVQKTIQKKVGATVYGTLHEYGVLMGEAEEILNATSGYINEGYQKARDIKWGVEHRLLPLMEINKVLLEDYAKKNNDGITS